MLSIDGAVRETFRTGYLNYILIRREGVRIHHASADKEDKYFPRADCDPHGQGTRWYMCRFPVAFGTMATIGFVRTHHCFLPDENGDIPSLLESHFSLLCFIIHHIHTPRPTTIANIMIPPNHELSILFHLLILIGNLPNGYFCAGSSHLFLSLRICHIL
jgi:hypothetical protein